MNKVKWCYKCGLTKPVSGFSKNKAKPSGLQSCCKACDGARDRVRVRVRCRKRTRNRIEYLRAYSKKYLADPSNSLKIHARIIMRSAISNGSLIRQPCKVCGVEKAEGHHPDYNKPLKVVWLCDRHHQQLHSRLKVN